MRVQITAAILCSMAMMVHAAPDEGIITGRVVAVSGRRVADVEVASYGREVSKNAVTDAQGAYAFGGLDEGRYLVVVEGPPQGPVPRESLTIDLKPGQRHAGADIHLVTGHGYPASPTRGVRTLVQKDRPLLGIVRCGWCVMRLRLKRGPTGTRFYYCPKPHAGAPRERKLEEGDAQHGRVEQARGATYASR